jgi:hypothetical protein
MPKEMQEPFFVVVWPGREEQYQTVSEALAAANSTAGAGGAREIIEVDEGRRLVMWMEGRVPG